MSMPMHETDLEFHRAQAGRGFAGQQSAADYHDGFLVGAHLAECERIANRAQVNDIAEANPRHRRTQRTAPGSKTSLIKLDAFAIPEDSDTTINIKLRDDGAEPRFDF